MQGTEGKEEDMQGLPFGPQNMPYYGQQPPAQPSFMQPPAPPPMVQTPIQQAAQQPPAGDIWSDIQTFSRTPQGQQALLAFANSAMQASMNPQTGGGAGLIGAVGAGMQGYKAADEYQEKKARQKKDETFEDEMNPLRKQYLQGQIAGQGQVDNANKVGSIIKQNYDGPDGRGMTQDYIVTGITKEGRPITEPRGKPYHRAEKPQPPQPRAPHALSPMMISWFQSPAGGSRKDIRTAEDLAKLTPEQSAAFLEVVKKNPQMQGGLMALLLGEQQQQAAPIQVAPEELK